MVYLFSSSQSVPSLSMVLGRGNQTGRRKTQRYGMLFPPALAASVSSTGPILCSDDSLRTPNRSKPTMRSMFYAMVRNIIYIYLYTYQRHTWIMVVTKLWTWRLLLLLLLATTTPIQVQGHIRWYCPAPRSPDTGIKVGPCGDDKMDPYNNNNNSSVPIYKISPGPFTVQWEESVSHTGAPFFIALTQDGRDNETCVLLDHIPHNDATNPQYFNESTWGLYSMTIEIPNVKCERCSLQIVNPMTDKIGSRGAPNGPGCLYPDCWNQEQVDVYHSCTWPIQINGTIPRDKYVCPKLNPSDWPTTWQGDSGQSVNATTRFEYRRESGTWQDSFLLHVPDRYRKIASTTTTTRCLNTNYQDPVAPTRAPTSSPPSSSSSGGILRTWWTRLVQWFQNLWTGRGP